jgi:hypothetical protein
MKQKKYSMFLILIAVFAIVMSVLIAKLLFLEISELKPELKRVTLKELFDSGELLFGANVKKALGEPNVINEDIILDGQDGFLEYVYHSNAKESNDIKIILDQDERVVAVFLTDLSKEREEYTTRVKNE